MRKKTTALMLTMLLGLGIVMTSCKKDRNSGDEQQQGESFVKLHVNGSLVYETNIVNAYHILQPGGTQYVLQFTSTKTKVDGSPQFVFNTIYNREKGTVNIVYTGNSVAGGSYFDGTKVYLLSEKDASGNKGNIDVTITGQRSIPNTTATVLSGTFQGKLVASDKSVINISGSFNDHAYPHYGN